ncbi:MAG: hypothetical protein OEX23_07085 [Betaproteobacteria bacterium]|nr:hypothetical protein [Betaproteobacteria bacterium]
MHLDDALRQGGFRRWYERQLIEGHVWLVTAFLALIMVAIALEVLDFRGSRAGVLALAAIVVAGLALVAFAVRRFHLLLGRAEQLAEQAVCGRCRSYGRFDVVQGHDAPESLTGRSVRVRCRGCAHEWQIG